jgi:hypothetical protein
MYHLELREFPHNLCRFNLSEQDLRALLAPWVIERPLELGERKWSPHQATLTVLEGPRLELQQLSMGRGWRAAQRQGEDVTARVIAAASDARRAAAGAPPGQSPAGSAAPPAASSTDAPPPVQATPGSPADGALSADPLALGVQLAALLGDEPARLLGAWRQVSTERPGLSPSETLAAAEEALRSSRPAPG